MSNTLATESDADILREIVCQLTQRRRALRGRRASFLVKVKSHHQGGYGISGASMSEPTPWRKRGNIRCQQKGQRTDRMTFEMRKGNNIETKIFGPVSGLWTSDCGGGGGAGGAGGGGRGAGAGGAGEEECVWLWVCG